MVVHCDHCIPQIDELFTKFVSSVTIESMVEQNYLRFTRIFWVFSDQNVSRMRVTMNVTVVENHFSENLNQKVRSGLSTSKLLSECSYVIDSITFNKLLDDHTVATYEFPMPRHVQPIKTSKIVCTPTCIDRFLAKVQLLHKTFLKMIEELSKV